MKLINKIFIVGIGILIIVFCLFKTGVFRKSESDILQVFNKVIVGNEMIVKTSKDLELEKVKIKTTFREMNVYENGEFKNNIGESYGGPVFDVYYDEILIGIALHDNKNDWYVNEFNFSFFKLDGKVRFNFVTKGKDKNGSEGYIWIDKVNNKLFHQSFNPSGKLINSWYE